jgi:concentrative nucleoside transporter, CNT family
MYRLTGVLGIAVLLGLAWFFSTNRKAIRVRTVAWGLGLQFLFAVLVLDVGFGQRALQAAGAGVRKLLESSFAGSSFVFGDLGAKDSHLGFFFAFVVLPTIIFVSAFFALLYHLGVMQGIVRAMAWVMTRLMGISGAEALEVAASIFMGQTEAPLTIRPYLPKATLSELMTIMTAGMAHVSGSIMVAYIAYGIKPEHLLGAVIMTAPGTILVSKMLVPETEQPVTAGRVRLESSEMPKDENFLGAIARGTLDGLHLALNVAAMLIAFIALIALINMILGGTHNVLAAHGFSYFPASLEQILGVLFAPIAWLIGIPGRDVLAVGNLLGTRMVVNELVAFSMLGAQKAALDPRSVTIATYALCGFANFSSIGIQIGGIGALAPERRGTLAKLGMRAMLAGTMANLLSAAIVGILL